MVEEIYNKNVEVIYKYFYFRTFDVSISEDLTSQTFLIFVEKMGSHSINKPEKFLFGIMRNVWLRYLQKKYRQAEELVENMDDFQAHVIEEVESEMRNTDEQRVRKFVNMLPPKQKHVMTLRLVERQSLSQICEVLNKDMNYVKTTQKRAIKKLRQLIEEANLVAMEDAQ